MKGVGVLKRWKLGVCLLILVVLLTGCSDYSALEKNVSEKNRNTDAVITNYETTKTKGSIIEDYVLGGLESKNSIVSDNIKVLSHNSELVTETEIALNQLTFKIHDYIAFNNEMANNVDENSPPIEKINDVGEFISTHVEVNYFLDDKTAKTEQMFLVELPDGYVGSLSFIWVGGVIIDVEAYNVN